MPLVLQGATSGQATVQATDAQTVTLTLPATSGTLSVSGGSPSFATLTVTGDASISGLTVGKGGGSIAGNTALGASALAATNTGTGYNVAVGFLSLNSNTSGQENIGIGVYALGLNTTGSSHVAVGRSTLQNNTTGSNNTGLGKEALFSNTTASNNTAIGYQAGYINATGNNNVFIGTTAGYTSNVSGNASNTAIGHTAGYSLTTGIMNTFVGGGHASGGSGYFVTTGSKNSILGNYNGNSGGLDIRTASNYIVLSDGDGNPRLYTNNTNTVIANALSGQRYSGYQINTGGTYNTQMYWDRDAAGGAGAFFIINASGGVYLGNTATSWTSASDERLKENLVPITDALTKVDGLRAVVGNYIADENKKPIPFLIGQDVQAVLPEAVSSTAIKGDDTEYLGVQYTETIPLLVAAIKELNAKVTALEAQLGAK